VRVSIGFLAGMLNILDAQKYEQMEPKFDIENFFTASKRRWGELFQIETVNIVSVCIVL